MNEYEILKTCKDIATLTGANMGTVRSVYRNISKHEHDHKRVLSQTLKHFQTKKDGMQ